MNCTECNEPLDDDQDPDEDGTLCEACQVEAAAVEDMWRQAERRAEGLDPDEDELP